MTKDEFVALIENLRDDLKQFMLATVSQATADMATKADLKQLGGDTKAGFALVHTEIKDLRLEVVTIADAHAEDILNHVKRIIRLEHGGSLA